MKLFNIHWMDGKEEIVMGDTVQEAFRDAGIGGGAMSAVDYYEEVKELPFEKQLIKINGDVVHNTSMVSEIKKSLSMFPNRVKVNGEFSVMMYNRIWQFLIEDISGGFMSLKKVDAL